MFCYYHIKGLVRWIIVNVLLPDSLHCFPTWHYIHIAKPAFPNIALHAHCKIRREARVHLLVILITWLFRI
ncbi:hypothetical protein HanRHA438_Chr04g0198961 [Helianthus annuus]|nr:hypothetical protein HanRHA438_Chr04g0198961 [Helianthus annuus]